MLQLIYELRKNCCGTGGRDGTGIEGSIIGPRGPKKRFKVCAGEICALLYAIQTFTHISFLVSVASIE